MTDDDLPLETMEDSLRGRQSATAATAPFLFLVLEGDRPLAGGARYTLDAIDEIVIGRGTERKAAVDGNDGQRRLTLQVPSPSLSRIHARLQKGPEGWLLEDGQSRNGSYLNGQRVSRGVLEPNDVLEVGHAFLMIRTVPQRPNETLANLDGDDLAAEPAALRTLVPPVAARLEDLRRVARSRVPVLLSGETGTGKEVLARAVHELSSRTGPFVAVNCSTLTDGLAGSQLFGHIKGAFSGAISDSVGFVRAADRGTLLLDEVGDLSPATQGALLRVLQESEVVPVGRSTPQTVDVRFVATTPRALETAVGRDQFRSDLFARLSGFIHPMTPLRERREDIGLLVGALLRKAGVTESERPAITPEMGLELLRYAWPLNVRELEQVLVRSWLLADDGLMHAPADSFKREALARPGAEPPARPAPALSPEDSEMQRRLTEALATAKGNVTEVARALGKGRVQVHRLMRRLNVDPKAFRS